MKREIFNSYVGYICENTGVKRSLLFKKIKTERIVRARFLLYYMCSKRPMTITQIIELMAENDYDVDRSAIAYGINKIKNTEDLDMAKFVEDCAAKFHKNI
jgi:hypothetical protein